MEILIWEILGVTHESSLVLIFPAKKQVVQSRFKCKDSSFVFLTLLKKMSGSTTIQMYLILEFIISYIAHSRSSENKIKIDILMTNVWICFNLPNFLSENF